jgi:hypothetical protein
LDLFDIKSSNLFKEQLEATERKLNEKELKRTFTIFSSVILNCAFHKITFDENDLSMILRISSSKSVTDKKIIQVFMTGLIKITESLVFHKENKQKIEPKKWFQVFHEKINLTEACKLLSSEFEIGLPESIPESLFEKEWWLSIFSQPSHGTAMVLRNLLDSENMEEIPNNYDAYNPVYYSLSEPRKEIWKKTIEVPCKREWTLKITGSHSSDKLIGYCLSGSCIGIGAEKALLEGGHYALDASARACLVYNDRELVGRSFLQLMTINEERALCLKPMQTSYAIDPSCVSVLMKELSQISEKLDLPLYISTSTYRNEPIASYMKQQSFKYESVKKDLSRSIPIYPHLPSSIRPLELEYANEFEFCIMQIPNMNEPLIVSSKDIDARAEKTFSQKLQDYVNSEKPFFLEMICSQPQDNLFQMIKGR